MMSHFEFILTAPDGQELFYQAWTPPGEPKAVVCLMHGLGEHSGRYAHVARALNDARYALLGYDQRGHGKTPGPRGVTPPFETLLDDISGLLEQAAQRFPGLPRFLYGHSMGGTWVLNHAIQRQPDVSGIVVSAPLLRTAFAPPPVKVTIGKILYRLAPDITLPNGLERAALSRDPEVVRAYSADSLVHDKMSARLGLDLVQQGQWALQHAAEFPPIPLLLVHGTADRLTSSPASEEFAGALARAAETGECGCDLTLKLWPGYYHEIHNEPEKDQVLCYMIDWLDRVGGWSSVQLDYEGVQHV